MTRGLAVSWLLGVVLFGGCGGGAFGTASSSGGSNNAGSGAETGGSITHVGGSAAHAGSGGASSTAGTSSGGSDVTIEPSPTGGDPTIGAGGESAVPPQSECPCAAPRPTCEDGKCVSRGPHMVKADAFYVDATEVTVADYAVFLRAKADDTANQPHECTWNSSFEPAVAATGDTALEHPITNVDYCDAAAYCAWADKRLCGKIGGGPVAFADLALATSSQWFAACGGPKGQPYPYGGTHQAGACNDSSGIGKVAPVGSLKTCDGFYSGVFDMVGNVAEWVDACDAANGAADGCETIGGSFDSDATCSTSGLRHRNEQLPTVGFRCCSKL